MTIDARFIPLNDNVWIQLGEREEMIGSIIVPQSADRRMLNAKVLARGPLTSESLLPGVTILLTPYHTGVNIELSGEKFIVVREKDILGVVNVAA